MKFSNSSEKDLNICFELNILRFSTIPLFSGAVLYGADRLCAGTQYPEPSDRRLDRRTDRMVGGYSGNDRITEGKEQTYGRLHRIGGGRQRPG